MNVGQLRATLESLDDSMEVRLMSQPSWPFEYSAAGTWIMAPEPDACGECGRTRADIIHDLRVVNDDGNPTPATIQMLSGTGVHPLDVHEFESYNGFTPDGDPSEGVVYIVEGTQLAYGTKRAWDEMEVLW